MNLVLTGASRGIGLQLATQALAANHHVIAVARDLNKSIDLKNLCEKYSRQLQIVETDVTHPQAVKKIFATANKLGSIDLLINNAGVYLHGESAEDLIKSYQINTIAPFLLTKELLPLLKKSKSAKVVHITSKMGSIADNTSGGYYAYRSSKAALNMINKSLAIDNPWLCSIVIHPGWVKTDMGGSNAPLLATDSALGIWNVISKLSAQDSGRFFEYSGKHIPW